MKVSEFLEGLEMGGMWDEYCVPCDRTTPHPEGVCKQCGTDPDA